MAGALYQWLILNARLLVLLFCILAAIAAFVWAFTQWQKKTSKAEGKKRLVSFTLLGVCLTLAGIASFVLLDPRGPGVPVSFYKWFRGNRIYSSIFWTIVVVAIIYALGRAVTHALSRSVTDIKDKHKIRKGIAWGRSIDIAVCLVIIWAQQLHGIGTFLGILGAAIALSLQEALLCIVGWVLIVIRKPYDIGDRVEMDGAIGDVIDIRVFQTSLLEVGNWVNADQSTGRVINIANSAMFRSKVSNYTKGFPFIWNELTTLVTFDSDWKRAKEIVIQEAVKEAHKVEREVRRHIQAMQRRYAISYTNLTPTVYTRIESSGVALTLRYLTPVRNRRGSSHKMSESILEAFTREPTIDFAYPTQTIQMSKGLLRQEGGGRVS